MEDCNVADILCQLETLRHLRGLQQEMGKEIFTSRFPEFAGLESRLIQEIESQEENLTGALTKCKLVEEEVEGTPEEE